MNTDPIADMITRIRNAQARKFSDVKMPSSKSKLAIAQVLKTAGYIADVQSETPETGPAQLIITLKYHNGQSVIRGLQRVSSPGQRMYSPATQVKGRLRSGIEDTVVSTSKGVMTGAEAARQGVGGEVLFKIW